MSEKLFVTTIESIFVSQKTRQKPLKNGGTLITETGTYVPHITGVEVTNKGVILARISLKTPINLNVEGFSISAKELFFKELQASAQESKTLLLAATNSNEG